MLWWFGCVGIIMCMFILCSIVSCSVDSMVLFGMKYGVFSYICWCVVWISVVKYSELVFWLFVGLVVSISMLVVFCLVIGLVGGSVVLVF